MQFTHVIYVEALILTNSVPTVFKETYHLSRKYPEIIFSLENRKCCVKHGTKVISFQINSMSFILNLFDNWIQVQYSNGFFLKCFLVSSPVLRINCMILSSKTSSDLSKLYTAGAKMPLVYHLKGISFRDNLISSFEIWNFDRTWFCDLIRFPRPLYARFQKTRQMFYCEQQNGTYMY